MDPIEWSFWANSALVKVIALICLLTVFMVIAGVNKRKGKGKRRH